MSRSLKNRAKLAVEGYRKFMVKKGLLNANDELDFIEANVKDSWKSVIQITKGDEIIPSLNRYYSVSKTARGNRGYTLKGFNYVLE